MKAFKTFKEGSIIQVYPSDTQRKKGKILEITDNGIVVEIIELGDVNYTSKLNVGDIIFYSFAKVSFKVLKF